MLRLPVVRGVIQRRLLINYRVAPDALTAVLPPPFRPQLVAGWGVAGICLIRLAEMRPRHVPSVLGVGSENAAHRIAVEWDENGVTKRGVYIPRRDTSSRFNALAGGRLFPGLHQHAAFDVAEEGDAFRVALRSDDGLTRVSVAGRIASTLPETSVFANLAEASTFFEQGSVGYSATERPGSYDGLELRSTNWQVEPLDVEHVESSFFDDRTLFPPGTVEFDCALIMRNVSHEWHAVSDDGLGATLLAGDEEPGA
jgi:hypothetical protein